MTAPEPNAEYYTDADRRAQLARVARACQAISVLLADHGDRDAGYFSRLAAHIVQMRNQPLTREELREVAGLFPVSGWWHGDPRDGTGPLAEPEWQEQVVDLHRKAWGAAQNLRTVGTLRNRKP